MVYNANQDFLLTIICSISKFRKHFFFLAYKQLLTADRGGRMDSRRLNTEILGSRPTHGMGSNIPFVLSFWIGFRKPMLQGCPDFPVDAIAFTLTIYSSIIIALHHQTSWTSNWVIVPKERNEPFSRCERDISIWTILEYEVLSEWISRTTFLGF
jgi:hypothetical protein